MADVMDGAVQQAPQPVRQFMRCMLAPESRKPTRVSQRPADHHWQESFLLQIVMAKSAAFEVIHQAVAGALMVVQPMVSTVAHDLFDRWSERHQGTLLPWAAP